MVLQLMPFKKYIFSQRGGPPANHHHINQDKGLKIKRILWTTKILFFIMISIFFLDNYKKNQHYPVETLASCTTDPKRILGKPYNFDCDNNHCLN